MNHFQLVEKDIDVRPILQELERHEEAWEAQMGRKEKVAVQREAAAIPIRGLRRSCIRGRRRRDVHESRYTSLSEEFPAVKAFLEEFAAGNEAELGRARIVRLPGTGHVHAHVDRGDYYRIRDRYHLVLQSAEGSHLRAADEEVWMRTGELWWFDNKRRHEAHNDAELDRIHLIFDLLPRNPERRRGPAPAPTGFEDLRVSMRALWNEARHHVERHDVEIVQQGVRIYLLGRENIRRWERFLAKRGRLEVGTHARPIGAIAAMLAGSDDPRVVRRLRCAMLWAIERIEAGTLAWSEIPEALATNGGVRAVGRRWRNEQRVAGVPTHA
jgi:hypothetical protein